MRRALSFCAFAGMAAALAFAMPASAADFSYGDAYAAPAGYGMVVAPPAGAVRYNRPCTVSDGYSTVVLRCHSASSAVAGLSYAPPVFVDAAPADPVVYADYARYRPRRAYRSARWHYRGHAHHRWHAHRHHGAHHGAWRHHRRH
jgi:hypothetical protein